MNRATSPRKSSVNWLNPSDDSAIWAMPRADSFEIVEMPSTLREICSLVEDCSSLAAAIWFGHLREYREYIGRSSV